MGPCSAGRPLSAESARDASPAQPLTGAVALVTGASRGIGWAIAARLRADGATVVGTSRHRDSAVPQGVDLIAADVSDPARTAEVFAEIDGRHGPCTVLVNNAGIQLEKAVTETRPEEWNAVIAANLTGPFLYAKEAIPRMREAGGGVIVNIGSTDSFVAEPDLAAYVASKTGLLGLTRSIAVDYAADNIRCVCVCPTYVDTEIADAYYAAQDDPAAARERAAARHPLGRVATPADIADVVAWACGDGARFVTGQPVVVDGGALAAFGA
jgi:NAD(P)-dependent dehydrogenase (short-subunit alcohol dehydrogenase family)